MSLQHAILHDGTLGQAAACDGPGLMRKHQAGEARPSQQGLQAHLGDVLIEAPLPKPWPAPDGRCARAKASVLPRHRAPERAALSGGRTNHTHQQHTFGSGARAKG